MSDFSMEKAIVAGVLAGGVAGIAGNPADVVNVRMQNDGKLPMEQRRNYRNALDGLLRIVREEGPVALFRGLGANVCSMDGTAIPFILSISPMYNPGFIILLGWC